ncbi:MAG: hypothetical protein LBH25_10825 [Fibromonadaceae bacterium]|nr:hypothetical protein [Fibromonadaceae bacterium]
METKQNSKGKRFFAQAIAAGLMLAMAFTLNACGGDGGGGGGGDDTTASSSSGNGNPSSSSSTSSSSSVNYTDKGNDIASYRTVTIGTQVWMAENLNFNADGSRCYGNDEYNCSTYGRLYDWATAMGFDATCNSSYCADQVEIPHQGVCPSGWHIPSDADWDALIAFIHADKGLGSFTTGRSDYAGKYLKATSGWYNCGSSGSGNSYLCEDTYGFSALPGGSGLSSNSFSIGDGRWWSSSEYDSNYAYGRLMEYNGVNAGWDDKSVLYSVRCLQD